MIRKRETNEPESNKNRSWECGGGIRINFVALNNPVLVTKK